MSPRRSRLRRAEILRRIAAIEKRRTLKAAIEADLAAAPAPIPEFQFVSRLRIEDKVHGGLIPFRLWAFRKSSSGCYANEAASWCSRPGSSASPGSCSKPTRSTVGTFWGNRLFLIVSQTGEDAIAALERIRIMSVDARRLAAELVKNNTEEILFANGSRLPAPARRPSASAVARPPS